MNHQEKEKLDRKMGKYIIDIIGEEIQTVQKYMKKECLGLCSNQGCVT